VTSTDFQNVMNELARRHRSAMAVTLGFLVLDLVLVLIAYLAGASLQRPGDPSIKVGLWIAILVFGLGAFVIRRTKFAAMRLKDIAAVKGTSALLSTLQGTTIQVASIGGAIALMGFMITIRSGDWTDMLRAAGVAAIVLVYGYPFRSAWQRVVIQLSSEG
jgi:membrane protein DedA with SNARE-associated domain